VCVIVFVVDRIGKEGTRKERDRDRERGGEDEGWGVRKRGD